MLHIHVLWSRKIFFIQLVYVIGYGDSNSLPLENCFHISLLSCCFLWFKMRETKQLNSSSAFHILIFYVVGGLVD